MNWKLVRFKEENGFIRGHLYIDGQWVSDTYEFGTMAEIENYTLLMAVRGETLDTLYPAVLSGGSWHYISPFKYWNGGDILPIERTFSDTNCFGMKFGENTLSSEGNRSIFEHINKICKKGWNNGEKLTLKITTRYGMGPGKKQ